MIGKYEVCLSGYQIRTFVGTALYREASRDFSSPEDAEKYFHILCDTLKAIHYARQVISGEQSIKKVK